MLEQGWPVQALSEFPSTDRLIAMVAHTHNDGDQSVSQKVTRLVLDEILLFTTSAVRYLNEVAKLQHTPGLVDLLSQLCSVSGIVLQLQDLIRNETPKASWSLKMGRLGVRAGPFSHVLRRLQELLDELARGHSSSHQAQRPGTLVPNIDLTELARSLEGPKKFLLCALQNEPRYAGTLLIE